MSELESLIEKENLKEFERQLERLGFFTQNGFSAQGKRISEIESLLYGLINALLLDGTLNSDRLNSIAAAVKEDIVQKGEEFGTGINIYFDANENDDIIGEPVNCEERLHICKAVCCKLNFALSKEEIENGKVKWDLGVPYQIRQAKDGYCTHNNKSNCHCTVYEDRPRVCKKYTCAKDERIWKDFEKMELNEEWINGHLKENQVRFIREPMFPEA